LLEQKRIAVVIPTYNREKLLINAVKSVLNQTYPVTQIFICDDGSNDNSFEKVTRLNDERIIWINCGRNSLPSVPRNYGLSKCTNVDYIAFLDSDDVWMPQKLERQISVMSVMNVTAICSNAIKSHERSEEVKFFINEKSGYKSYFNLIKINKVICSSVIIHKSILIQVGQFNELRIFRGIEDYDLWLKIARCTNWYFICDELLYYNDHSADSVRNDSIPPIFQKKLIIKFHLKWLLKRKKLFLDLKYILYNCFILIILTFKIKIVRKKW
jgi:glycosyltransferase involved in cell wall biosynthesis